jgi:hypothetical protein
MNIGVSSDALTRHPLLPDHKLILSFNSRPTPRVFNTRSLYVVRQGSPSLTKIVTSKMDNQVGPVPYLNRHKRLQEVRIFVCVHIPPVSFVDPRLYQNVVESFFKPPGLAK